jgi:hypothetical protein
LLCCAQLIAFTGVDTRHYAIAHSSCGKLRWVPFDESHSDDGDPMTLAYENQALLTGRSWPTLGAWDDLYPEAGKEDLLGSGGMALGRLVHWLMVLLVVTTAALLWACGGYGAWPCADADVVRYELVGNGVWRKTSGGGGEPGKWV